MLSEIGEWSKKSAFLFISMFTMEREIEVEIFSQRAKFFDHLKPFQAGFLFKYFISF